MAYTPELSYRSSCTLRRIAWALNMPMTKAMERVFDHLAEILDRGKVCKGCRDKTRCDDCVFNNKNLTDDKEDYKNG
jgi:recombinational DNA repair protein RecR